MEVQLAEAIAGRKAAERQLRDQAAAQQLRDQAATQQLRDQVAAHRGERSGLMARLRATQDVMKNKTAADSTLMMTKYSLSGQTLGPWQSMDLYELKNVLTGTLYI